MKRIGAHVSAAGGAHKAVARAAAIGANCVQLFSGSPRSWARTPVADLQLEKVFSEQKKEDVNPIFIHSIYLINLVADKPELLQKSHAAVAYDLEFCSAVQGAGVVVHLGSHQGRGWEAVRESLARLLTHILTDAPKGARLLIENSAGQQGKLCSEFSEIRWLLDAVKSPQLGWCLDTCHAWAGGYFLGEEEPSLEFQKAHVHSESALAAIDRFDLWEHLHCVHVNDSRDPYASGRDRHENLLDGSIPSKDLSSFLQLEQLEQVPFILEVPGLAGEGPDAENVHRLESLLKREVKRKYGTIHT